MSTQPISFMGAYCPIPLTHADQIVIGHGSGGKMTHDLVQKHFFPRFNNDILLQADDGSRLENQPASGTLIVSTDSHVVSPLFFPGGDIGRLAISGTVNDVAVMGADVKYITAGFILEEGFYMDVLDYILDSMQATALEAGVKIVAGDTKVVQKGKADGLFITTTGIGQCPAGLNISGDHARPGDDILISGALGNHGIAVLQARGDLGLESNIQSDVAPLNHLIHAALQAAQNADGNGIHVMRDPTRGGLATTLNEIASQSNIGMLIDEESIPLDPAVLAACEILGFDPLYIANEGKCIFIVDPSATDRIMMAIRNLPYGARVAKIGKIVDKPEKRVLLKTHIGSTRILDMLAGEMLPRIC